MSESRQAEIVDTSRLIIKKGSKSFAAAAKFFAPETREYAYMLYAWCRYCDDVIDNQTLGFDSKPQDEATTQAILAELREKTQAAIDNKPSDDQIFEGLRIVIQNNQIPGRYPLELLEGFAMDARAHEYKTFDDTLLYCYYVAGVVGIMMACLMGAREPAVLERAADLGIAFQLTNISRDVREDAEIGRTYLPAEWLDEAGIPADKLLDPEYSDALVGVVGRLLKESDRYYESANEGFRALGFRSAWAVASARVIYKAIGDHVRKGGAKALQNRVIVPRSQKILGVAEGMLDATKAALLDRHKSPVPRDRSLWNLATRVGQPLAESD